MKNKPLFTTVRVIIIIAVILLFVLKFFGNTDRGVIDGKNLLDGGWMYALPRLPQLGIFSGKDVFFTYGPLAGKLSNIIIPGDLSHQILTHKLVMASEAFFTLFYLWLAVKLYRKHPVYGLIAAAAFLFNYSPVEINDSIVYATIALLGAIFYKECSEKHHNSAIITSLLFSLFSAGALLYKVPWGVPGFFSIILLMVFAGWGKNSFLLKYSASCLIFFFLFSFIFYQQLTGGSINNFFLFLNHSYDQTTLYSQMMSQPVRDSDAAIFAAILLISLAILVIFYRPTRIPLLIAAPALFTSFKAGFVRADAHMLIFFNSVVLILLCIPLIAETKTPYNFLVIDHQSRRRRNWLFPKTKFTQNIFPAGVLALALLFLVLINKDMAHCTGFDWQADKQTLENYLKNGIDGYVAVKMKESDNSLSVISNEISGGIEEAVRGHDLAVIPWALAVPDALGAKPLFYPSLQFYSGYTEGLDEANLKYFQALSKDACILLQTKSIDFRYFLNDCPRTFEWLLANYQVIKSYNNWFLLERRKDKFEIVCGELISVGRGLEISLPLETKMANQGFERIIVNDLTDAKYGFRTFFLRGPWINLELKLSDGTTWRFHTFPEFLRRGIWVSPYFRDKHDLWTWTNGSRQSLPRVIGINIKEDTGRIRYLNPAPTVYIQKCVLMHTPPKRSPKGI